MFNLTSLKIHIVHHPLPVSFMFLQGRQLASLDKEAVCFEDQEDQCSGYSPSFFHFKPTTKNYKTTLWGGKGNNKVPLLDNIYSSHCPGSLTTHWNQFLLTFCHLWLIFDRWKSVHNFGAHCFNDQSKCIFSQEWFPLGNDILIKAETNGENGHQVHAAFYCYTFSSFFGILLRCGHCVIKSRA